MREDECVVAVAQFEEGGSKDLVLVLLFFGLITPFLHALAFFLADHGVLIGAVRRQNFDIKHKLQTVNKNHPAVLCPGTTISSNRL